VAKIYQEIAAQQQVANGQDLAVRILNVSQTYFPYVAEGGRPAKVRALSRKLAERGHSVTVVSANLGVSEWLSITSPAHTTAMGLQYTENGVVALYLPTLWQYRVLTVNPRVIAFCRVHLSEFDLVHFYGLYDLLGPVIGHYSRRGGIPYVIEPMGMYRPIDRNIAMKNFWHRTIGRALWRNAACVVATSELEQEELVDAGVPQSRIAIRYNGIADDLIAHSGARGRFRSQWGISESEPVILFLSRLIPRKGADLLIQAFAQVCPLSGRLVIAGPEGETGYRAHLEECARESGVGARVLFTGPVYDDEKSSLLVDSDIFVLPSRYENFANVAAEAMAFGIPVIVTPYCGIGSLVDGRAGLVVTPERDALIGALKQLLNNKALYAHFKEGCREVASQLSWDHLTEQMEGYYKDVLAGGHGSH
jgi:glycosyltransferase involved in cell wall biosynthesis